MGEEVMKNNRECSTQAQEMQQICVNESPRIGGFVVEGPRVDSVPPVLLTEQVSVRYRLDVTEAQLNYLHDLVSVDEGDHAEDLSSTEFDELVGLLVYHHSGIHGPSDTDDRPPQADNE
jgi:hypothetical protein